jgi:hypothetical protein
MTRSRIALLAVLLAALAFFSIVSVASRSASNGGAASSSVPPTEEGISDGTISFRVPLTAFGLATHPEEVKLQSYIPPCNSSFAYCVYLSSGAYAGTNFESAGITIAKRPDLTTKQTCLTTPPAGYTLAPQKTQEGDGYAASVFSPLGDAAAGHYATEELYRLSVGSKCYEFLTRIGESQFANYPAGTIKEFSSADRAAVHSSLRAFLDGVTLDGGRAISFPQPSASSSS